MKNMQPIVHREVNKIAYANAVFYSYSEVVQHFYLLRQINGFNEELFQKLQIRIKISTDVAKKKQNLQISNNEGKI